MNSEEPKFGSAEFAERLGSYLQGQNELFRGCTSRFDGRKGELWTILPAFLFAVSDSCDSMILLGSKGKVRDTFVVARTIFETIVNTCFILAKGDSAAITAQEHAAQKSYRDLSRTTEFSDSKIELGASEKLKSPSPEISAALQRFTSRKGREITAWTPETVKEQIDLITDVLGASVSTGLKFGLVAIYRHASDITHGTYFGILFSLGVRYGETLPGSQEDLLTHNWSYITMLMLIVGMSVSSLIEALGSAMDVADSVTKSKTLTSGLGSIRWSTTK